MQVMTGTLCLICLSWSCLGLTYAGEEARPHMKDAHMSMCSSCQEAAGHAGHYLQSLGKHSEAAAAYEAAAASAVSQGASTGSRRAAELYQGLALAGAGTPPAVEAARGILSRTSDKPDQDPAPIL